MRSVPISRPITGPLARSIGPGFTGAERGKAVTNAGGLSGPAFGVTILTRSNGPYDAWGQDDVTGRSGRSIINHGQRPWYWEGPPRGPSREVAPVGGVELERSRFLPGTGRGFSVDDEFQAHPMSCESLAEP